MRILTSLIFAVPMLVSAQTTVAKGNIVHVLSQDKRFSYLSKMLKTTGMDTFLSTSQPYTIFAPIDKAFEKLPADVRKKVVNQDEYGSSLAAGFVVKGKYGIMSFSNGTAAPGKPLTHELTSFHDTFIRTVCEKDKITVNGATILGEIIASNGTIVIVDRIVPIFMEAPAKSGLSRALSPEMIKWGLGKYVSPR